MAGFAASWLFLRAVTQKGPRKALHPERGERHPRCELRAARGAAGERRGTGEIREEFHGDCPAEPFEARAGAAASFECDRAGFAEPPLLQAARERSARVCYRVYVRGWGMS